MKPLDDFTRAYIEAALWSSHDESTPEGGDPLDLNYGVEDIAPESLMKIQQDCDDFRDIAPLLWLAHCGLSDYSAGHDFWLTRNHHGAGFWDRGLGKVGDALTTLAERFGEVDFVVGDDGKIYQEP